MDKDTFWKNFELGVEVDISGRFIYNSLRGLHEMDTLYQTSEIFEFLYNLSVGIERLSKIAIILIEHDKNDDQEAFKESLITHNHIDLIRRVKTTRNLKLSESHHELLQLLSRFYKSHRYGRYGVSATSTGSREKQALQKFIEKYLNITISDDFPFNITQLDTKIRSFMGRTIGKIVTGLYRIIEDEASRLGIYTYEIRYYSKAYKIFIKEEFDFFPEDILWKELLIAIANTKDPAGHIKYLRSIPPLPFDFGSGCDHLQAFTSEEKKLEILDELEHLYSELESQRERIEAIVPIGDPRTWFEDEDQDDDEGAFPARPGDVDLA